MQSPSAPPDASIPLPPRVPVAFSPYAPPATAPFGGAPAIGLPGADVVLYTPNHVALATFLGTPLGGSIVLALNERRLGRGRSAVVALLVGVVTAAALIGIAFALPKDVPGAPLGLVPILAMRFWAQKRQAAVVSAHHTAGGKIGSAWAAAGIGLASLTAVMVPVFVIAFVVATVSQ
jgi:hypothetical protein